MRVDDGESRWSNRLARGIVQAKHSMRRTRNAPNAPPDAPNGDLDPMWQQHAEITFPTDEKAAIWRYLDFAAFIDLLDSSSLHFSRLDALGDPFEGYGTAMDYLKFKLPEQIFRSAGGAPAPVRGKLEQWRAQQSRDYEQDQAATLLKRIAVAETCWANCWHMTAEESIALWKIYHGRNKIIAVLSTVGALRDSIRPAEGQGPGVSIGAVQYVDDTAGPALSPARQAISKNKAFAYEQELRAVLTPSTDGMLGLGEGVKVPVDLPTLVTAVRLSPIAQEWHVALAERLLERHGLQRLCEQSLLFAHPEFIPSVA